MKTLHAIVILLDKAVTPEDIFGVIKDGENLSDVFKKLAKIVHPDVNKDKVKEANDAFQKLQDWYHKAQDKVEAGTYGDRDACDRVTLNSKKGSYTITARVSGGDLSEVFVGVDKDKKSVLVKICRTPSNNDLVSREASTLQYLLEESPSKDLKVMRHIPVLVDSFSLKDGKINKQVNIFKYDAGGVTLEDVKTLYPDGIDAQDMAWMFNRLLASLMAAHQSGVVHGAITPEHFIVFEENHNGLLIDWSYSVKIGSPLKAIVPKWLVIYPDEIKNKKKKEVNEGVDIYMAAMCARYLLGKKDRPRAIDGLLNSCLLGPNHRPTEVFEVIEKFKIILEEVYGERKFRKLSLTNKE